MLFDISNNPKVLLYDTLDNKEIVRFQMDHFMTQYSPELYINPSELEYLYFQFELIQKRKYDKFNLKKVSEIILSYNKEIYKKINKVIVDFTPTINKYNSIKITNKELKNKYNEFFKGIKNDKR